MALTDDFEQAVAAERAYIARCRDVRALLDRMAEYREHLHVAVGRGDTLQRLRLADLLELAEDRIVRLKREAGEAEERRAVERRGPDRRAPPTQARDEDPELPTNSGSRTPRHVAPPAPPPRVAASEDRSSERLARMRAELDAERAARESADLALRRARERAAAAERAAAEMEAVQAQVRAERESRLRVERERAEAERIAAEQEAALFAQRAVPLEPREDLPVPAAPHAPRPVVALPRTEPRAAPPRVVAAAPCAAAVGTAVHAPAPSRAPGPSATSPTTEGAPPLTGSDLARFRAARGITQREAASLLGVSHGTVGKAERRPGEPLGRMLQGALGRLAHTTAPAPCTDASVLPGEAC